MYWLTTPHLHDTIFVGTYKPSFCYTFLVEIKLEHMRAYKVEMPLFHNCYSVMHCNWRTMRIQYKCLVLMYVFPEMKLLYPKLNYNVLSSSSYTHISVRFIYFQDRSAYYAAGKYEDRSGKYINLAHRNMNVEIRTEAVQFPEKEYMNGIFLAVWCRC